MMLNPYRIPDPIVFLHNGEKRRFYTELVKNQIVIIHFVPPVGRNVGTRVNICKVAQLVSSRGIDVRLISISYEPSHESTLELVAFASKIGSPPAWSIVSAEAVTIASLHRALFRRGFASAEDVGANSGAAHSQTAIHIGCGLDAIVKEELSSIAEHSEALARYGNEACNLWGTVPLLADPQAILSRLDWLRPAPARPNLVLRRGGPWPRMIS